MCVPIQHGFGVFTVYPEKSLIFLARNLHSVREFSSQPCLMTPEGKTPLNLIYYTTIFLWFSHGFPIVVPWFSHDFPLVFPWFSHGFPMEQPPRPPPGRRKAAARQQRHRVGVASRCEGGDGGAEICWVGQQHLEPWPLKTLRIYGKTMGKLWWFFTGFCMGFSLW